jgi:ketosteroid isomerase-like protein
MSFSNLPAPVLAYIKASNGFDLGALVATFSEKALVNDQQREYANLPAIRNWAAREIIGDRVTMDVTGTAIRGDNIVVTANMDGAYDKTGLADPLILTFYFSLSGDRIEQLIILRNKASQVRSGLVLAHPLDSYFDAKNKHDAGAMLACFAEDAIVVDEHRDQRGRPAIREWIEDTTRKYRMTADPIDTREHDGKTVVTCLLSGDFTGSPAKLRYAFTLSEAKIARLEIV